MKYANLYGLIGYPLSHSFSQRYFTEKFEIEKREGCFYQNFPIENISDIRNLLEQQPDLRGFNVTFPYKEKIIPYLDEIDAIAENIGAVNTVRVTREDSGIRLKGYNTDVYGFIRSLEEWFAAIAAKLPRQALILGSGGASKAVSYGLNSLNVMTNVVSRKKGSGIYKTYDQLTAADIAAHILIINSTPLGMFPRIDECPAIQYQYFDEKHYLYDLVYNPSETLFMRRGREKGALAHNGERMLHLQADEAWKIWQMA